MAWRMTLPKSLRLIAETPTEWVIEGVAPWQMERIPDAPVTTEPPPR